MKRTDVTAYIGKKFNRMTVVSLDYWTPRHGPKVHCACDCGALKSVSLMSLRGGDTKSCGCLLRDKLALPTNQRGRSDEARVRSTPEYKSKRASQNKWTKKNKDKVAATAKRFRERHKNEHKTRKAEDYQRRKPKIYAKLAKRFKEDIEFRLSSTIRARIRKALRVQKVIKSRRMLELLGCSLAEFRTHIESQFLPGMSWDAIKQGLVHIDHKTPVRFFDMRDATQQAACFHFSNHGPMWKPDNLAKSDKLPDGTRARDIKRESVGAESNLTSEP